MSLSKYKYGTHSVPLRCYINERLHISSNTKTAKIVKPTSKKELRSIIMDELNRQGPDADLNFIDTSEITDMFELFVDLDIQNIKIDQWDVSNVTSMVLTLIVIYLLGMYLVLWTRIKCLRDVENLLVIFHCGKQLI